MSTESSQSEQSRSIQNESEIQQQMNEVQDIEERLDNQNIIDDNGQENIDENQNEINNETLDQIDKLQTAMNKALQIVGLYKNEIDELRLKIGDMKEIIQQREQEDKQRVVVPIVNQLSQIYKEEFTKLIDQNRLLESELVNAIQEKQEVVDQIYSCVDKIKILEQQVFKGQIPPYLLKKIEQQKLQEQKILETLKEQSEIQQVQQSVSLQNNQ